VQLKCRTGALFKPGPTERGNLVHFEVRKSTFNDARQAFLVAALLDEGLSRLAEAWFVPMVWIGVQKGPRYGGDRRLKGTPISMV
jgi:hypothetical protein